MLAMHSTVLAFLVTLSDLAGQLGHIFYFVVLPVLLLAVFALLAVVS